MNQKDRNEDILKPIKDALKLANVGKVMADITYEYYQTLKDRKISEYTAIELTKAYLMAIFSKGK